MFYLTPERLRTQRVGVSLTGVADIELVGILSDAKAITDAFCLQPLTPVPGDFLGQSIVDEELPWRFPTDEWSTGSRRVYPKHWPVRSVSAFKLIAGAGVEAGLDVDQLVINNRQRWVAPTSVVLSNSSGLFGLAGWILPYGGLPNPVALLSYESGWQLPVVNDRLYPIASGSLTYQGSYGWWIEDSVATPLSVTDNGSPAGAHTLDLDSGQVTFSVAPTGPVKASYFHKLPQEIESAQRFLIEDLVGAGNLLKKGFASGVSSVKAGEITISRSLPAHGDAYDLWHTVPRAAQLLSGFIHWSMA